MPSFIHSFTAPVFPDSKKKKLSQTKKTPLASAHQTEKKLTPNPRQRGIKRTPQQNKKYHLVAFST